MKFPIFLSLNIVENIQDNDSSQLNKIFDEDIVVAM